MWHKTFSDIYKRRKSGVLCEWNNRPLTFTALHKCNTPGHASPPARFMHCGQCLRSGKRGKCLIHSAISSCQTHVTRSVWSLLYQVKQIKFVSLLSFEMNHSGTETLSHQRTQEKTPFLILKMENLIAWNWRNLEYGLYDLLHEISFHIQIKG